jgi:hypothetical protein
VGGSFRALVPGADRDDPVTVEAVAGALRASLAFARLGDVGSEPVQLGLSR